jgi:aryl-alcohol dehydrogenase-like predicted oxidoreductase
MASMTSRLIFGGGRLHRVASSSRRQRILSEAQDAGLVAFDVAPAYGNGIVELELGSALRGRRVHRVIHTKFGIPVPMYPAWTRHVFWLRRLADRLSGGSARGFRERVFGVEALTTSLEGSLRRLQTDYVDALFIHEPLAPLDPSAFEAMIERAERLKHEGKIRAFGVAGPLASVTRSPSPRGLDIVQTRWGDVEEAESWGGGRPVIAYGAYDAYRNSGAADTFETFVARRLAPTPQLRVIVTSNDPARVRAFGRIAG